MTRLPNSGYATFNDRYAVQACSSLILAEQEKAKEMQMGMKEAERKVEEGIRRLGELGIMK